MNFLITLASKFTHIALFFLLSLITACGVNDAPNQSTFLSLEELAQLPDWEEKAFARLYKDILPTYEQKSFTHPWLVLKQANSDIVVTLDLHPIIFADPDQCDLDFDPYNPLKDKTRCGLIHLLTGPLADLETAYFSDDKGHIMGELRGADAERVVSFAFDESINYKCKSEYSYIDANSNTYIRWILEMSGWNIVMGASSWGQQYWKRCQ